ncbi:AAEL017176-PA [Aedes aegypti]|uniref:AAEL017176-PA n=1 Tax=Aedes aegypti TaxID=7159 RepID=J9HSZ6_AEDAE|nr:AAEL017176-PA [Aedes aegypti]
MNRLIVDLFDLEMMLFDISFVVVGGLKFILCNLLYSAMLDFSFQSLNSVSFCNDLLTYATKTMFYFLVLSTTYFLFFKKYTNNIL